MAINSKAPITADKANSPVQGRKGSASPIKGCLGARAGSRAKPLTVGRLRAIKKQLDMNNKRDSLTPKGAYPGTGRVG